MTYGFADFLAQSDLVGRVAIIALVLMSLATWYLIVAKLAQSIAMRRRADRFLREFWDAPSLQEVSRRIETRPCDEPFSHLTRQAIAAVRHHARLGEGKLSGAGSPSEYLTRAMRSVIDEETAKIESGLTLLASVGSTAPFVGLFGTVWGVYHALVNIGMMGQGSLDKVAGPVGEALIMTALGLAVAIPAVLAYNAFTRGNRLLLARLDSFAHSLYSFLTTGEHLNNPATVRPLKPVPGAARKEA